MNKRIFIRKVVVDVSVILIVLIPFVVFVTVVEPYRRGYFCDDNTIRYPYKEDTITILTVALVGILLPTSVIIGTELMNHRRSKQERLPYHVHPLLWTLYHHLSVFVFGCCMTMFATEMAKLAVGRLRPNFIFVCNPDKGVNTCEGYESSTYITEYICLGQNAKRIKESRLSFPSGHASFSVFTMVYLSIYLQARLRYQWASFLRQFLQYTAAMAAFYTCLSRISDHKHHYSDVLGGTIVGLSIAFLTGYFLSDLFPKKLKGFRLPTAESQELKTATAV